MVNSLVLNAVKIYDFFTVPNDLISSVSALEATRTAIRFGLFASVATISVFLIGGSLAPLESASISRGTIMPSDYKKTVQHLEGGIIEAILVKEGDQVVEGQPLVRLSKVGASANSEGLKSNLNSAQTQLDYINEELATETSLVERGLSTRSRLLAFKHQAAELQGKIGELHAVINKDQDVLNRTVIAAPIAGIVNDLKYHTVGGVIPSGSTIMDIVPKGDQVLIDAEVMPRDISRVNIGQDAKIMFSTYKSSITPMIMGKIIQVSPDRVIPPSSSMDVSTQAGYYRARVEVAKAEMEKLTTPITLTPGMPVEVMVLDGKHSLLSYYLQPFFNSFHRAFREQ